MSGVNQARLMGRWREGGGKSFHLLLQVRLGLLPIREFVGVVQRTVPGCSLSGLI